MKAIQITAGALLSLLLSACQTQKPPALGEPLAGLSREQRAQFEQGKKIFQRVFEPKDGLGPLFNGNSCAECHESPVIGGVGDEVELHATRSGPQHACDPLFDKGGPVIQQHATPLLQAKGVEKEQVPPEATAQAHRSTPPLFGFGLVDAIPESTLLAYEDPRDSNADGIAGRANRTIDGRVGRFGRKAAVATLAEFNAGAFPQEMGVTTPQAPVEETNGGVPVPPETDPAPDPEISAEDMELVNTFLRYLAPPPPQKYSHLKDQLLAKHGQELFAALHCDACHVPKMVTGPSAVYALDRKSVALYSDLLLHDMGPGLADICLEQAGPADFRTEMLMGLRFRESFLHDGSAKTVQEAIERHGGEAQQSSFRYKQLGADEKNAMLKFLQSL
jgi:CxxC motif-containing protein (DUF1111 family)